MLRDEQFHQVREALDGATASHNVRQQLETRDAEGLAGPILAFGFHFLSETAQEARERHGGPWGPMVEADGWQFPPPLDRIEGPELEAWAQMLGTIDHPAVQARCGDLLWVRKHQPAPHNSARAAVEGYLALAEDATWSSMERTEGLGRALEIAQELRDASLVRRVAETMLAGAREEMASDQWRPGITLRLLQPLVALAVADRPPEVVDALNEARKRYENDPYIVQAVTEGLQRLSSPEGRRELQRALIRRWIEEGEKGDALLRLMRLQQALELALQAGLADEAEDVRARMQSVAPEELDLKRIEVELPLPTEYIEALCRTLAELPLPDALRYFGAQGPPTGEPSEAEQAAADALSAAALSNLLPTVVLGQARPTPIFRADTDERRRRLETSRFRTSRARVWAAISAHALRSIFEHHRPTSTDFADALTSTALQPEIAERIARGFELYAEGDYDDCAHVVAPRIEAGIRELAAAARMPVTKPPRGEEPGGVVSLGELLKALQGPRLDEGWRLYLVTVLVDQLGLNLRNDVSHGTRSAFNQLDAALLLHVACMLAGVTISPGEGTT